jgi:hypothetical protein
MAVDDYFWKAFEATGSPQMYLMYKNRTKAQDNERDKRNANL